MSELEECRAHLEHTRAVLSRDPENDELRELEQELVELILLLEKQGNQHGDETNSPDKHQTSESLLTERPVPLESSSEGKSVEKGDKEPTGPFLDINFDVGDGVLAPLDGEHQPARIISKADSRYTVRFLKVKRFAILSASDLIKCDGDVAEPKKRKRKRSKADWMDSELLETTKNKWQKFVGTESPQPRRATGRTAVASAKSRAKRQYF